MIDAGLPLYSLTVAQFKELLRAENSRLKEPNSELPKYLSPTRLSELTNWKLSTVYQNHHNGLIPGARKMGGRLLFETTTILSWIEENAIPTKEEKIKAYELRGSKAKSENSQPR